MLGFKQLSQRDGERNRFLGHVLNIQIKTERSRVKTACVLRPLECMDPVVDCGGQDCSHYSN